MTSSIALVYDVARWEEKAILSRAKSMGIRVEPLHLSSTHIRLGGEPGFDAALVRAVSHNRALAAAAALESTGVRCVNNAESLYVSLDKIRGHAALARAGVPLPETIVAFTPEEALRAAESMGYPVVVKPVQGSWGRMVALARDAEALRSILEYSQQLGPSGRIHYIQEYIEKPGRDIRSFCIGDTVPAAIYRVSSEWITNTARGGRAEPLKPDPELEELTLRACRATGVEFGGVDVVEDRDRGYLVLEVNGVPEFKNTVRVTGVDIPGLLVEYVARLGGELGAGLPGAPAEVAYGSTVYLNR